MAWNIKIGQGATQRLQPRVVNVEVDETFGHLSFTVIVENPTIAERDQAKGRIDDAIIQISRGSDIIAEGFIEDVEVGAEYVRYYGRGFLSLIGYSTASSSDSGGTEAEYDDDTGKKIIEDLIDTFCVPKDAEITKYVTFPDLYGGTVRLHGKKVYQIVRDMCQMHGYDLWSDATWNVDGINIDNKNIRVGMKERPIGGGSAHMTLYGGRHFRDIPVVKYRSSQAINCLRVIGGGSGKDKISVYVTDAVSIAAIGSIEGEPYHNNMIKTVATAESIGQAIILAKKDPIEELRVVLITYINDLRYGDWVNIIDTHSNINTLKRIKRISRKYNAQNADEMSIELGEKFDDYQNIVRDLTKGDVDDEPEMAKQSGSFRITANTPPKNYVRVDKGTWYDTTGTLCEKCDTICVCWGTNHPSNNMYKKALVQIADAGSHDVTAKYSAHQYADYEDAQNDIVVADATNTPLGEIILRGDTTTNIDDIYNTNDNTNSYIYRDVRPIVGSVAGSSGGLWESSGTRTSLITSQPIDVDEITFCDWNSVLDCQTGGIINLVDPILNQDAATKKYVDDCGGTGLWQTSGARTSLNTDQPIDLSEELNMGGAAIDNLCDVKASWIGGVGFYNSDGLLRATLGTTGTALFCTDGDINLGGNEIICGGGSITNASIPGINDFTFIMDQDRITAGVNTDIQFNRGSTANNARLTWNESNTRFTFEEDVGVTLATLRIETLQSRGQINLDDSIGCVTIKKNDGTGDMEFTVSAGDSFVFKTV